jgi:hypothetical protein
MVDYKKAMKILEENDGIKQLIQSGTISIDISREEIWVRDGCEEWNSKKLDYNICNDISRAFFELAECFSDE